MSGPNPLDSPHPHEAQISPGDLVAQSLKFLEDHPAAPLDKLVISAIVIVKGGDRRRSAPIQEVADVLKEDVRLVRLALDRAKHK